MNKRIKIRLFTRDDRFKEFFLSDNLKLPDSKEITEFEEFILNFVIKQSVLISLCSTSDIKGEYLYIETDNEDVFFKMYNYLMKKGVENRGEC